MTPPDTATTTPDTDDAEDHADVPETDMPDDDNSAAAHSSTPPTLLDVPSLPAGTEVDLSRATMTLDDHEFTIPTALRVERGESWPAPHELSMRDWMVLARRTAMLHGLHMDRALASTTDDDARARRAALVWVVPDTSEYLYAQPKGEATSTMSYTARVDNLVHNRIREADLSVSSPFVAGAASVARDERQASLQTRKHLYMTGRYRYAQADLDLPMCTAVSPRLVAALESALAREEEDRIGALRAVFADYGHVVPRTVTVGAQLVLRTDRDVKGDVAERDVKTTVKAAVDAKYKAVSASASASFQDATGSTISAQDLSESVSFRAIGGRVELASNPDQWAATVADPNRWAIIDRADLQPLVDRLEPDLADRVRHVWREHLHQLWGDTMPEGYDLPDLAGQPFTMANGGLLRPQPIPGRAAETADRRLLADALPHGLAWRLEYRGKTTEGGGRGQPLYRIVEHVDDALAATRRSAIARARAKNRAVREATGFTGSEPIPAEQVVLAAVKVGSSMVAGSQAAADVDRPEDSPASWTLTPVQPDRAAADGDARAYVVRNHATNLVLGQPSTTVPLSSDPSPWMLSPLFPDVAT